MNIQRAKKIPLPDILARLGHEPHHVDRAGTWYASPFRAEEKPSFCVTVTPEMNAFYDFGSGAHGNVIDFAMQYYHVSTVSEALARLDDLMGVSTSAKAVPPSALPLFAAAAKPAAGSGIELKKVQPLQNRALLQYLSKRGIDAATARPYVKEAYYAHNGKHYFALAFENRSGGYEFRNPYWKSAYGTKDISVINAGADGVAVFEGFMDFLSAFSYPETHIASMTAIVLNSTAMKHKAVEVIRQIGAPVVHLYLDHDEAGRTLTAAFQQSLADITVLDRSSLYAGYKDCNARLEAERSRELC